MATTRRIYDRSGADWKGVPRSRSHKALVRHAVSVIRSCGAYGDDPDVELAPFCAEPDVVVESHGEKTGIRIYSGDCESGHGA